MATDRLDGAVPDMKVLYVRQDRSLALAIGLLSAAKRVIMQMTVMGYPDCLDLIRRAKEVACEFLIFRGKVSMIVLILLSRETTALRFLHLFKIDREFNNIIIKKVNQKEKEIKAWETQSKSTKSTCGLREREKGGGFRVQEGNTTL